MPKENKFLDRNFALWNKIKYTPQTEGLIIKDFYCLCGWCNEKHAIATSAKRKLGGTECIVWTLKMPCVDDIMNNTAKKLNKLFKNKK